MVHQETGPGTPSSQSMFSKTRRHPFAPFLKMAGLRETREMLLLAHADGLVDDEEFILLFDINKSRNPDFPY